MKSKGFTLIELLAVLVILGLLAIIVSSLVTDTVEKAKTEITKSQESSILNAAEMWSIDNSEKFDDIEGTKIQIGLDVVFILDISTSMNSTIKDSPRIDGSRTRRFYAMVDSVNLAMKTLEGENNRQAILLYGGECYKFMPLGSYSSPSKTYIKMEKGNTTQSKNRFMTSSDLKKDGVAFGQKFQKFHTGTETQNGIIHGTQILLDVPSVETKDRIPVVILLTDGEPGGDVFPELCSSCSNSARKKTGLSNPYYYALMAGYERNIELKNHYNGSPVYFYTIGFGIKDTEAVQKLLSPNSYPETSKYNYVTKSFIGSTMTSADLSLIFDEISTEVVEATNVTQVCITVQELYDNGYLSKQDINMADGEAASTYVIMSYNEATSQYSFSLAKTETQKKTCQRLLEN